MQKFVSLDDFSIFDTTGELSENDLQEFKEILAENLNEAFNCYEEC